MYLVPKFSFGNGAEDSSVVDLDEYAGSPIYHNDIQGFDWVKSLASSSHLYHLPISSDILETSYCQNLLIVVSPSFLYPGGDKGVVRSETTEAGNISSGTEDLDLITCSSGALLCPNGPISSPCGSISAKVCISVDSAKKNDSPKSVPVEIFSSETMDIVGSLPFIYGSADGPTEHPNSGALFYEPPTFPSLEIPFFSFDLIPSGGKAYSPFGIQQLMTTPREIDATRLEKGLCEMEGVVAVHELHIWAITVGKVLLACHVTITPDADADLVLDKVIGYIRREYNISHVTIQIERQ
ncbi:hypothetical protein AAC387_Pa10g0802 [Persea americana]